MVKCSQAFAFSLLHSSLPPGWAERNLPWWDFRVIFFLSIQPTLKYSQPSALSLFHCNEWLDWAAKF